MSDCERVSQYWLMEQCTLPEHNLMFCCNYAELCELCYVGINCSILHLETWLVSLSTICIWTAVLLVTISPTSLTSLTVKVFSKKLFQSIQKFPILTASFLADILQGLRRKNLKGLCLPLQLVPGRLSRSLVLTATWVLDKLRGRGASGGDICWVHLPKTVSI